MQPPGLTNFYPLANIITAITNASPAVITTLMPHGYRPGNIVRVVTEFNGTMLEINGKSGLATILSPTTLSIPVDSRDYGAFTYFTEWTNVAQVIPIAEVNVTLQNAEQNIGPNNPLA